MTNVKRENLCPDLCLNKNIEPELLYLDVHYLNIFDRTYNHSASMERNVFFVLVLPSMVEPHG